MSVVDPKPQINTKPLILAGVIEALLIIGGVALFVLTGSLFWAGVATSLGITVMVFAILNIRSGDAPPPEQGSIVEDARGRR